MLEKLIENLPDYAKDIKLNFSSLLSDQSIELTQPEIMGIILSTAVALKNQSLTNDILPEAKSVLSAEQINAIHVSLALMAMNNSYYRFNHMVHDQDIEAMPAGLRMNGLKTHGIDHAEFEKYSLAVSIVNGCELCISSHAKALFKAGVSKKAVQDVARIVAVITSLAQVHWMMSI